MVKNIDDLVAEIKTYHNPITGKIEKISKRQALEMTEDIMTKSLNEIDSIQLKIDAGFIFEDYIKYKVEGGFLYFNKLTGSVDWCDINATRVIFA